MTKLGQAHQFFKSFLHPLVLIVIVSTSLAWGISWSVVKADSTLVRLESLQRGREKTEFNLLNLFKTPKCTKFLDSATVSGTIGQALPYLTQTVDCLKALKYPNNAEYQTLSENLASLKLQKRQNPIPYSIAVSLKYLAPVFESDLEWIETPSWLYFWTEFIVIFGMLLICFIIVNTLLAIWIETEISSNFTEE